MTTSDNKLSQLIINKLSKEQYASITPNADEIYLVEDDFSPDDLSTVAYSGSYNDLTDKPSEIVVDQIYNGTSTNAQSGVAVKSAIDTAISSVYKPKGSIAFASRPTLSASVLGNVYNITDAFTTTSDFVEGASKSYPAGTNIVVINTGTDQSPTYKFDVLSGMVDLSSYQTTSTAVTHTNNTTVGSATNPVYVDSSGVATACTYTLSKSVPSNAVFTDTNTKVTQNVSSTNSTYPVLLCPNANASTNQGEQTSIFASGVKVNPSTSTITATTFDGNASTASKLGTADKGSATQPIYLSGGTPTACTYTLAKSVPSDAVFTDTTYSAMTGASSGSAGTSGLVPQPSAGDQNKVLKGDGTWGSVSSTDTQNTAGGDDTSSKIFLVGMTAQTTSNGSSRTYTQDTAFVDANGRLNSAAPASGANDTTVATTKWVKDQGYTSNTGTITGIKMNGASKGTSGVVDLGTVITSHQDISGKQDTSTAVTHTASTAAGSATQPVYVASTGVATACTYTLGKSVPSDALFTDTDTKYTAGSSNSTSKLFLVGATAQGTAASNAQAKTTYSNSAVYEQNGYLYATTPASTTNDTTVATTKFVKDQGYTSNTGTITGITMNGASKGSSGVVDLGTVITSHQDISGKQDTLVSGTNIKTINSTSILGNGDIAALVNTATGTNSLTISGTASSATSSVNIGATSTAGGGYSVALGYYAASNGARSTSIGYGARIGASTADAIQIGNGTNSTAKSLSVGFYNTANYQLLDGATGLIPDARISDTVKTSLIIEDHTAA